MKRRGDPPALVLEPDDGVLLLRIVKRDPVERVDLDEGFLDELDGLEEILLLDDQGGSESDAATSVND